MKTILATLTAILGLFGLGYVVYRYTKGGKNVKADVRKASDTLKSQFQSGKDYVKNLFSKPATEKPEAGTQSAAAAA